MDENFEATASSTRPPAAGLGDGTIGSATWSKSHHAIEAALQPGDHRPDMCSRPISFRAGRRRRAIEPPKFS